MTEPHPDDEALSAVLDGEDDDAERAHVEGCPACQGRLDDLRAVSRAVAVAIPPRPAASIDAAIGRALAEAPPAPIRRVARRARPDPEPAPTKAKPPMLKLLAAAAVVVVVAGIGSVIVITSNHHDAARNSATSATSAAAPSVKAAGGSEATGAQSSPAPRAASAPSTPADLGDQSDPAALVAALRAIEKQGGAGSTATIINPPDCAAPAAAGAKLPVESRAILDAAVRWQGKDAQVLVFPRTDTNAAGQTAVVVSTADCTVVTSVAF